MRKLKDKVFKNIVSLIFLVQSIALLGLAIYAAAAPFITTTQEGWEKLVWLVPFILASGFACLTLFNMKDSYKS